MFKANQSDITNSETNNWVLYCWSHIASQDIWISLCFKQKGQPYSWKQPICQIWMNRCKLTRVVHTLYIRKTYTVCYNSAIHATFN